MTGQRFGSYVLLRKLGEGGMGVVYEAVHEQIGRRAAIKILNPEFSRDPQIGARFLNEARAVNIVQHAGLVGIFEFGQTPEGAAYLVMEYLDGESLRQRIDRLRRLPAADAARLLRQMATALAAAHAKGIIHRDLKPENVIIVPEPEIPGGERAKLLDFGIAKVADEAQRQGGVKTQFGAVLGTPAYMAPEQCQGAAGVDERADVYALGVMTYEMLSGDPPFVSESPLALIVMQLSETPRPLQAAQPDVPAELAALVDRMLAKDPKQRPAMTEVARAAERLGSPTLSGFVPGVPVPTGSLPGMPVSATGPTGSLPGVPAQPAAAAFVQVVSRANLVQNYAFLDHPGAPQGADALLLATPRWYAQGQAAVYNNHPIGVWYAPSRRWAVYNEDRVAMPEGAAFNVAAAGAFVHRAVRGNIVNNWTLLDHPAANNRPDALVFITPHWNPGGQGGVYNPHHTGVWYTSGRWAIYNQDRVAMPEGAAFNVLIVNPPAERAFLHRVAPDNLLGGNATRLGHPLADGNANAVLIVTANWNPGGLGGVYHDHAVGLYHDGQRWALFDQDLAPMTVGAAFNVWVCPG